VSPPRFSVNQVVLVNLLFLVLMLAGFLVVRNIPVDTFPDISFNNAILTTVWPGASSSEVERLVTTKIEEEVQDVIGIKDWASFSSQGVSSISVVWDERLSKSEQQAALADLRAAVDRVEDLPEGAEETILTELSVSEVFDLCMIAVSDVGGVGEYTLRELARKMERQAERAPGVRRARLLGARDRELRILIDKDRALQYDLTLPEISEVIRRNNQDIPGGTFSDVSEQEITVRGLGSFVSTEQLASMVVKKSPSGRHVTLADVAEVVPSFERRRIYSYLNGRPTISVGISKSKDADVSDVVAAVRALVDEKQSMLPPGVEMRVIWDGSRYVRERIRILRENLLLGVASVILILWLTVGFRNSMLAIIGVPFSFLTAMIIFPILDITINSLSLIGFVMVSGMLVDDAIIVLENIYRHIENGEDVAEATIRGTEEVMWPVIAAVCTTMAAFIPMLLVSGTSGEFMSILPKTVIACLFASLIECLFILPAHYIDWGSRSTAADQRARSGTRNSIVRASYAARVGTEALIVRGRTLYLRVLEIILPHRKSFLLVAAASFYFACGLSSHVPSHA